jgi:hypothetical protein
MAEVSELTAKSTASISKSSDKLQEALSGATTDHPSRVGSKSAKEVVQRRIIAEDAEWNLAPVPKLTELCIKAIVANFESNYC